jgi:glyoxylate utilization-related uncharacterized protein
MPQTLFIDTNALPRVRMPGGGEMTEILSEGLAGAKNVVGTLRWLHAGETFTADPLNRFQLLYLMDGRARVTIEGKTHDIEKGMGVYLAPSESAAVQAATGASAKLFHLVVRKVA